MSTITSSYEECGQAFPMLWLAQPNDFRWNQRVCNPHVNRWHRSSNIPAASSRHQGHVHFETLQPFVAWCLEIFSCSFDSQFKLFGLESINKMCHNATAAVAHPQMESMGHPPSYEREWFATFHPYHFEYSVILASSLSCTSRHAMHKSLYHA